MQFINYLLQSPLKFLFKVWLYHLILFFILRCVFYFVNNSAINSDEASFSTEAFFIGFRFDNVIICYSLFIPFILLSAGTFLKTRKKLITLSFVIFCAEFAIVELIICSNIPYFHQFGAIISKNAFLWGQSPGLMFGLIFSSFSYWGYLILFFGFYFISFVLLKKLFRQAKEDLEEDKPVKLGFKIGAFIIVGGFIFLGIRGTASRKTTIHQGFASISNSKFINSLGLNPCFVFIKSFVEENPAYNYKIPFVITEYFKNVKNYLGITNPQPLSIDRNISFGNEPPTKQNVVIVVMESMAMYKLGYLQGKNLCPNFNSLIKESVFFDRFYSSGMHTFNGLFSTETGFPAIYTENSLHNYTAQSFNSIGSILNKNNYENYFFTSHDPNYDNMAGFFKLNGYQHIIGESDFPLSDIVSTLGVPDHVLFDKVIKQINKDHLTKPFHAMVLTSSDHGPWFVPDNISFKPTASDQKDRSTQYADWCIGEFMKKAKQQTWYNNTIFIFLGDHGVYSEHTYELPLSFHNIPLVIHQPSKLNPDTISNPSYQPDIPATVMSLLKINYVNNGFGVDILNQKHSYIFFSSDEEYGIMHANGNYYFKVVATDEKHLKNGIVLDKTEFYETKKSFSDSMDYNANAIIEAARFLIHKNYYNK